MIVVGTGHRPNRLRNEWSYVGPFSDKIRLTIRATFTELENVEMVISGMALGYDQILAQEALNLRIPVLAAIPCQDQDKLWQAESKRIYNEILGNSLVTQKLVSRGPYEYSKMFSRDLWMLHQIQIGDVLLACFDGEPYGGTYKTYKYAQKLEKTIINIWDKLL